MATVKTSQGEMEVCDCGKPDGHVGAVWHHGHEHPSGAKLKDTKAEQKAQKEAGS